MKKTKLFLSLAAICLTFLLMPQTVEAAGFVQDTAGVMYQNDDGSFLKDSWVQVGQNIYHLDANGYVQFGWIQVGKLWYNLGTDGICINPNGSAAPTDTASVQASVTASPAAAAQASGTAAASQTAAGGTGNIFADAGWVPFQTADANILNSGVAAGFIGFDGAKYWAEPTFAAYAAAAASGTAAASASGTAAVTATASVQATAAQSPQYVWLPATGTCYHSINNCGRMNPKRATQVTLDEAISRHYEKCSKCF
ncbi:MAG: hypothetical protein IJ390_03785 [Lachnospiraceae bacterium]|nr:hypothetical protein [Lachnospiraceae bacterium]